jgi:hypothetical protein
LRDLKRLQNSIERSKKITEEYLPEWKKDAPEPTSRLRQGKPKLAKKGWKIMTKKHIKSFVTNIFYAMQM